MKFFGCDLFLVFAIAGCAQAPLTNEAVIKMVRAGLGEEVSSAP